MVSLRSARQGGAPDAASADTSIAAFTRAWHKQLEPFTGGYYQNIEFEIDETAQGNYGPAYERLAHVKGQYDPMNLFRLNSNVKLVG